MGKNARRWEYLSHHSTSQRARKQVLKRGWRGISHISHPLQRNIGTQLDELVPVKNCSCSALTAYATPCSILLPLAMHKKCGKAEAKWMTNTERFLMWLRLSGKFTLFSRMCCWHMSAPIPTHSSVPGKSQPPHDFPFNLPLLRLSSLSLSCWQTTLTWAKDKQFRPPFHSQGCRDSLWIEAWCYSIKFRSIHPQSIYNMVLMGGGWGLSERHSTLS